MDPQDPSQRPSIFSTPDPSDERSHARARATEGAPRAQTHGELPARSGAGPAIRPEPPPPSRPRRGWAAAARDRRLRGGLTPWSGRRRDRRRVPVGVTDRFNVHRPLADAGAVCYGVASPTPAPRPDTGRSAAGRRRRIVGHGDGRRAHRSQRGGHRCGLEQHPGEGRRGPRGRSRPSSTVSTGIESHRLVEQSAGPPVAGSPSPS